VRVVENTIFIEVVLSANDLTHNFNTRGAVLSLTQGLMYACYTDELMINQHHPFQVEISHRDGVELWGQSLDPRE